MKRAKLYSGPLHVLTLSLPRKYVLQVIPPPPTPLRHLPTPPPAPPPHPTTVSKRELADRKCCFRNVFHLEVRRIMELTQDVTRCHVSKPEKALPMTSHNVLDGRQRVNDSRPADEVDLNFCVRDAKRRPYTCLKLRCYVGYVPARPVSSGHVATLGSRLRRDLLHQLSCIGGRVT